ncbi:hypothetical protein [Gracilibacillus dipsosauri]|uniref:hypothetical protein n=1 Tax=Gracilibacillus dipsosauri TaxID=178340 RepID=UPI0024095971
MTTNKVIFLFALLTFLLIGCSQNKEEMVINGTITLIDENSGDMEVYGEMIIKEAVSPSESFEIVQNSISHVISVSNPEDYEIGQRVKVNATKNDDGDSWDLNNLKFEVVKIN